MTLLLAALAAAAAAREPRSAVLPVSNLRGGQLAQLASAEPPAAPLTASSPPELSSGAALQAHRHLHNLHTDALAMASAATLPAFAAASMRLHQQLLLLDDTEPPLGSPSALVAHEDATAL